MITLLTSIAVRLPLIEMCRDLEPGANTHSGRLQTWQQLLLPSPWAAFFTVFAWCCAGVHSRYDQLIGFVKGVVKRGAKRVRVHVLTDGRDVPDGTSKKFVTQLKVLASLPLWRGAESERIQPAARAQTSAGRCMLQINFNTGLRAHACCDVRSGRPGGGIEGRRGCEDSVGRRPHVRDDGPI